MKKIFSVSIVLFIVFSCKNGKEAEAIDYRIALSPEIINTVRLTDTLVIFEKVCRGCEYERSTHFDISDTTGIIAWHGIKTIDDNPRNVDGGSIKKEIELVPVKTGKVQIKLYKFLETTPTAKDSANAVTYSIEIIN